MDRELERDLEALADRARYDREFAVELYGALCNVYWCHEDGTEWRGTWRYAAEVVANVRGRGEDYMDFYCSGGEGAITDPVAEAMTTIGWHGVGHGVRLRAIDPVSGRVEVLGDDGEWIIERRGADDLSETESEPSLSETAGWGPSEDWADWAGGADDPGG